MYIIKNEIDRFQKYLEAEYQLFLNQSATYKEYLDFNLSLSNCLADVTKHGATYIAYRTLAIASENADDEGSFQLGEEASEFVVAMHNSLIDYMYDRLLTDFDMTYYDLENEEQAGEIIEEVFSMAFDAALMPYQQEVNEE